MRTPREILLRRHLSANPKLDDVRTKAVSAALSHAPRAERPAGRAGPWPVGAARAAWRELIRPCRGAWAGIAALWLAMWAINWGLSDTPQAARNAPPASAAAWFEALAEQRRLLAELIPPASAASPRPESPPRHPRPRSERRSETTMI